jgi:hypothetical protein
MSKLTYDQLAVGDVFYTTQPYRQYYVKLEPFEDAGGRLCNAEELESGKAVQWKDSPRFPIHRDDGHHSWKGPTRQEET